MEGTYVLSGLRIRLAVRDWDHLSPLLTGALRPSGFDLELSTRDVTPHVLNESDLDGGETSFSWYTLNRARGDERLVGLPVFVMRGFRHRCILVRADSDLDDVAQLAGRRIGLTGWPDSGNTWTRAILREADVDLTGIAWSVGPLVADGAPKRPHGRALANVAELPAGDSLVSGLLRRDLEAIFTPFMPPGFHEPDSPLRPLLVDYPEHELGYFRRHGFVPGIHILTLKREVVAHHPWLPAALVDLFDTSKRQWHARRRLLADTTPWLLADIDRLSKTTGPDWMPYGVEANARMTAAFCTELHAQGIADGPIDPAAIFADFVAAGLSADVPAAG